MNTLDKIDPLPALRGAWEEWGYLGNCMVSKVPYSRRQIQEARGNVQKTLGEDWQPYNRDGQIVPNVYINGKGHFKTEGHKPPEPPETDIPIPCVIVTTNWTEDDTDEWPVEDRAERIKEIIKQHPMLYGLSGAQYKAPAQDQRYVCAPQTQTASHEEVSSCFQRAFPGIANTYSRDENSHNGTNTPTNAIVDTNWIPHKPGDPIPCDHSLHVHIKARNGNLDEALSARDFIWDEISDYPEAVIIAWKPA
jgi:hypothetical protein